MHVSIIIVHIMLCKVLITFCYIHVSNNCDKCFDNNLWLNEHSGQRVHIYRDQSKKHENMWTDLECFCWDTNEIKHAIDLE